MKGHYYGTPPVSHSNFSIFSDLHIYAVNFAGRASTLEFGDLMSFCDSAGIYYAICPNEIMKIAWRDAHNQWHGYAGLLGSTGYHVGNGWDGWSEIGPIDLNDIDSLHWSDDDVSELWLMFKAACPFTPGFPKDIRIGWIKLEESEQ